MNHCGVMERVAENEEKKIEVPSRGLSGTLMWKELRQLMVEKQKVEEALLNQILCASNPRTGT